MFEIYYVFLVEFGIVDGLNVCSYVEMDESIYVMGVFGWNVVSYIKIFDFFGNLNWEGGCIEFCNMGDVGMVG